MADYTLAPGQDVIVSSRVRLARNFEDIPFVTKMTDIEAAKCIERVSDTILNGINGAAYKAYRMSDLSNDERLELVEHRLISNELIAARNRGAAVISSGRNVSVMVNEDDHIRIQGIVPGLQLERAAELAFVVDDELGEKFAMAFDSQFGYLTSYPTDVGTGMRLSTVLHLPALTATRQIGPTMQTVGKLGLTIRGFYGEGSEVRGNMYVLTNQSSLGRSEEDMLRSMSACAEQIAEHEREMRGQAEKADMLLLQDKLMRSLGEVMNAKLLSVREMTRRYSDLRYAAGMGYIHAPIRALDELLMDMQPGSLSVSAGRELSDREKDVMRAEQFSARLRDVSLTD